MSYLCRLSTHQTQPKPPSAAHTPPTASTYIPRVIRDWLRPTFGLSIEDRRNLNQALGIMLQAALARNPKVRRR